jgi:pimeloyl-ACP methyl ester carboxylesterase
MSAMSRVGVRRGTLVVDGLVTSYLEAGDGELVVLLHGGEFGASAELGWERLIPLLASRYRVLAPDQLGYGQTAKVLDFTDGRGMRIRHIARFCSLLGIESAYFAGNSMGAINLLVDASSPAPLLPARRIAAICGGGEIQRNEHVSALYDYDATIPAMRRIVTALFADPGYPDDDAYVRRRHESSLLPGAWEAVAAARFQRPAAGQTAPAPAAATAPTTSTGRPYHRIRVPVLVVEGGRDKLLPRGWAKQLADLIPDGRSAVIDSGHCPQIERPTETADLLSGFFTDLPSRPLWRG